MNKIFNVIFNKSLGVFTAVSEHAKSHNRSKSVAGRSSSTSLWRFIPMKSLAASMLLMGGMANAAPIPTGIAMGGAVQNFLKVRSTVEVDGSNMTVTAHGVGSGASLGRERPVVINWDSFDVGLNDSVTFAEPEPEVKPLPVFDVQPLPILEVKPLPVFDVQPLPILEVNSLSVFERPEN